MGYIVLELRGEEEEEEPLDLGLVLHDDPEDGLQGWLEYLTPLTTVTELGSRAGTFSTTWMDPRPGSPDTAT